MRGSKAPGRTRARAGQDDTRHWRPRAPDAKLTDRAQAVASVSRIVREHPEIETGLVGDGRTIYAKETKMVTADDVDDEMLLRDEEADNVKDAAVTVVRFTVDL